MFLRSGTSTLGIVGEWWTVLILHDCFDGHSRFDEFQANVGLSSSMLTSRLKSLVEAGILERRRYQERPPRYEYVLTELGRSLRPVLVALAAWRNAQLAPQERSMILVDTRTGREVEPIVVDAATGERVDDPHYVYAAGPSAGSEMRKRYENALPARAAADPNDPERGPRRQE